ncbi:MAG: hypothetical protein IT169_18810 [Bryobacterales bacterium]|nr:hypothetical protein [Bryobacterales bacterium]
MTRRRSFLIAAWGTGVVRVAIAEAPDSPKPPVQALRQVKRLCVEDFDGGENARQLRALLIAEIHRLGAFVMTENPKSADAFLRGFAEDLVFTERHGRDESISGRASGSISTGGYTRNRAGVSRSEGASSQVRDRSETRRHEASLSVRIVNADGDVLWSESAESRGGKFRSAGAEVADKIALALKATLAEPAAGTKSERGPSAEAP